MNKRTSIALGIAVLAPLALGAPPARGGEEVVVVANGNVPDSVALARHYMAVRGLPEKDLCVLDLPAGEAISRGMFEDRLRDPLLEFLRRGRFVSQVRRNPASVGRHETSWTTLDSSVRYLVCVYGVPVRIADTRLDLVRLLTEPRHRLRDKDGAAVDSELALLLHPGYDIRGAIQNPLFGRLSGEDLGDAGKGLIIAARLDGPDPETVRRMIDDAVSAERCGPLGRAYFDSRGLANSSYELGDFWIREAFERFTREGYEGVLDSGDPTWGEAFPMEDAAVYLGWYAESVTGPFLRPGFRFPPGAIAYHLHSSSAAELRTASRHWAGPLLARGAAATMGAVDEPFLSLTPQLNTFADRLLAGYSFGEAAYMSLASLSWQITIVGDPLYRPFRYSLDEQIAHLEQDGRPADWAYVRKINLLVRSGRFNTALAFCREKLGQGGSLVLRETLGDLYAKNDLFDEAGEQYEAILSLAGTAETALRVGARWLLILRLRGERDRAARIEKDLRARWKDSPLLPWLDTAMP